MIVLIASMIIFAAAYGIKGGQTKYVIHNIEYIRSKNAVLERLLDGKVLSTILVAVFCTFLTVFMQKNIGVFNNASLSIFAIAAGWLLSIAPSMGEEYGALMGKADTPYMKYPEFGRAYGVKKCIQRALFIGAVMALVTGYLPFILFSVAFVPIAYLCLQAGMKWGFDGWGLSEPIIGAVVFGIPFAMAVM